VDPATLAALIAALGGSAGLAALVKAVIDGRSTAKQLDLDVLREVVDGVQEENKRLSDRLIAYETTIIELRNQVREQKLEIEDLRCREKDSQRQIAILRRELEKAHKRIAELVVANEMLKEQVNGGRA